MQAVSACPAWLSLSREAVISRVELIESLFAQLSVAVAAVSGSSTLGPRCSTGLVAGGWSQSKHKASRLILSCPKILVASTEKVWNVQHKGILSSTLILILPQSVLIVS